MIREHRIDRGDVVISKAWLMERIQAGRTPQQMADEAFCCVRTIYYKGEEFGIKFRPLAKSHCKRVPERSYL